MKAADFNPIAPLFTRSRPDNPETSREAVARVDLRKSQRRVLDYALTRPDGFTDWEMSVALNDPGSTCRTRRSELTQKGLIVATENRRRIGTGNMAVVWKAKL